MNALYAVVTVIWVFLGNEKTAAFRRGCVGNYCFILSEYARVEILNQTDAQQWCSKNNGSQLVEIVSQDVQDAIETFIRGLTNNTNGLIIRTNGMRSPLVWWNRLSGKALGNITVLDDEYGFFYAYLSSSRTGFDIHATTATDTSRAGYVCTNISDSNCSEGMRMADGQCYRSFTQTTGLSWYDARNQCLNKGGDLASFDYITSNDGFNRLSSSWLNTSFSYWIGIRSESWTWQSSSSDVKYSNWQQDKPDGSGRYCLTLVGGNSNSPAFKWSNEFCEKQETFLCVSVLKTTPPTNSASTLISISPTTLSSGPDTSVPDESSSDLSSDAKIGIGVGLGVGCFLIIVVAIIAVVLNKKQHAGRTWSKKEPSHEMQRQTKDKMTAVESGGRAGEGSTVYAEVIRSSQANRNAVPNMQHQPPPLYQKLEFVNNGSHQGPDFRVNSSEMY